MQLNAQQIQKIARQSNVSENALRRLLGSVMIELVKAIEPGSDTETPLASKKVERFEIGMRLTTDSTLRVAAGEQFVGKLVAALAEYKRLCPLVYAWLLSGAFDPTKVPERVTRANVLHANRTIGRIRASLLRS